MKVDLELIKNAKETIDERLFVMNLINNYLLTVLYHCRSHCEYIHSKHPKFLHRQNESYQYLQDMHILLKQHTSFNDFFEQYIFEPRPLNITPKEEWLVIDEILFDKPAEELAVQKHQAIDYYNAKKGIYADTIFTLVCGDYIQDKCFNPYFSAVIEVTDLMIAIFGIEYSEGDYQLEVHNIKKQYEKYRKRYKK